MRNPAKSRFYFYNTGRYLARAGTYETRSFIGSHGAIGSVPWAGLPEDRNFVLAVAEWMNARMNDRGLVITLRG